MYRKKPQYLRWNCALHSVQCCAHGRTARKKLVFRSNGPSVAPPTLRSVSRWSMTENAYRYVICNMPPLESTISWYDDWNRIQFKTWNIWMKFPRLLLIISKPYLIQPRNIFSNKRSNQPPQCSNLQLSFINVPKKTFVGAFFATVLQLSDSCDEIRIKQPAPVVQPQLVPSELDFFKFTLGWTMYSA